MLLAHRYSYFVLLTLINLGAVKDLLASAWIL